jgi:transposase InsO family protein
VLEESWTLAAAAEAAGVSVRTLSKWLRRFREEGEQGLFDRSSAPRSVPGRTCEERVVVIAALRRLRMTAAEIAETLSMPPSTVSAVLTRIGLGKLSRLEPPEPANRYERRHPGELVHIDVKKLGRIKDGAGKRFVGDGTRRTHNYARRRDGAGVRRLTVGWEYVHVCVDDATRLAYVEVLEDEKAVTAAAFLRRAIAHFAAYGIRVERVMTDNGSCYRGLVHQLACRSLRVKHLRTRPYRPRTNGKAERFIRTMLGGWAYGAIYRDSAERRRALKGWLDFYNRRRPHGSLSHQPPLQRLDALTRNNLAGSYS